MAEDDIDQFLEGLESGDTKTSLKISDVNTQRWVAFCDGEALSGYPEINKPTAFTIYPEDPVVKTKDVDVRIEGAYHTVEFEILHYYEDHSFDVEFTLREEGQYFAYIKIKNEPISTSPISIKTKAFLQEGGSSANFLEDLDDVFNTIELAPPKTTASPSVQKSSFSSATANKTVSQPKVATTSSPSGGLARGTSLQGRLDMFSGTQGSLPSPSSSKYTPSSPSASKYTPSSPSASKYSPSSPKTTAPKFNTPTSYNSPVSSKFSAPEPSKPKVTTTYGTSLSKTTSTSTGPVKAAEPAKPKTVSPSPSTSTNRGITQTSSSTVTKANTTPPTVARTNTTPAVTPPVEEGKLFWWAQYTAAKVGYNVKDWTTSWQDGYAFCALIAAHEDTIGPIINVRNIKLDQKAQNIQTAINAAVKVGMKPTITPDDILKTATPPEDKVKSFVIECYNFFERPSGPPPASTPTQQSVKSPPSSTPSTTTQSAPKPATSVYACALCGRDGNPMKMLNIGGKLYHDGMCGRKGFVLWSKEKRALRASVKM
eukprot:TRINITY_DN15610_c0_g1_i1.p1 TRINITY_DN15610_c0_g1~~TRINITY_DN15610_c0_g1_i1.p1  ORF type:complete len:549 (+),score=96.84 TRINITY_DN15610_c0_g1_i1:29-1648(+)